ncbi:nif-specific transcriptional activator NifA [Varunaivibrio sulfuroxidans]|uniref:Nif-specific regulatory protein n=1 Tax=Varunaivibrio sulfuroxidans TaxID=1773489 RepID=A0A4R3J8C8_9PROT|nr:nif-specific transcriptional activator NifA [Varunaivibrio sulfuroxidans]TCS61732.1 Nif-specific regulatory protein [Varunaivibrio sulfuroxidans]WES32083.1 nif-specific transcriptional activator NifA [Varunaivibrio sulfuroxidans]
MSSYANHCSVIEEELDILYRVSHILSRSLNYRETLVEVLKLLHEEGGLANAMITLVDEDTGNLLLRAVHGSGAKLAREISYRPGEGIVGAILENAETVVVPRISEEPRFLGKLGVYDPNLPFIGVPIFVGEGRPIGVFAAQPGNRLDTLAEQARFLEMLCNLIAQTVRLALQVQGEQRVLKEERDKLRRAVKHQHGFDSIVGHTEIMRAVFEQVRMVSAWNTTVLIRGESGTGKELIANAIHYNSPRTNGPFIKLNCAALPDNLLESELFGHEKGAYTGANTLRKGRFELADGGTIFLDEIGEISPAFQAKLLRVLQEGEFERVGGAKTLKVDVRVITATNKDLEEAVMAGDFREDLYYRLNVMPIPLPALRERAEDIPDLAAFLVGKISRQQGRPLEITDSAVRLLLRHHWPGNVRELENTLERAAIMSKDGMIDRDVISISGLPEKPFAPTAAGGPAPRAAFTPPKVDFTDPDVDERERVIAALEEAGWVQAKAARLLDMTPRQIAYRIQTLDIKVRQI